MNIEKINKYSEDIINKFSEIANIPRKSKYEDKISEFIFNKCKELGCDVIRDNSNNVICNKISKPANEWVILQAHMDMVCVKSEDKDIDFLNDGIEVIRNENTLTANGTSLGADDGIGIAMIFKVLEQDYDNINIRAIFTSDEEEGMTGAMNLDAKYMINLDWEDMNTICNSSAGGIGLMLNLKKDERKVVNGNVYNLSISNLYGGHSGDEIHLGRKNAVKELFSFLNVLIQQGTEVNIAEVNGGFASNAIPTRCNIKFVINKKDDIENVNNTNNTNNTSNTVNKLFNIFKENLFSSLCDEDKDVTCELNSLGEDSIECFLESNEIVDFVNNFKNGVNKFSSNGQDVIASENIGVINLSNDSNEIHILMRSSEDNVMNDMYKDITSIAGENFNFVETSNFPSWEAKEEGKIAKLIKELSNELIEVKIDVVPIHAGLEGSFFSKKNKDLEIISMGPTVKNPHSINEVIMIDTIGKVYILLEEVLKRL